LVAFAVGFSSIAGASTPAPGTYSVTFSSTGQFSSTGKSSEYSRSYTQSGNSCGGGGITVGGVQEHMVGPQVVANLADCPLIASSWNWNTDGDGAFSAFNITNGGNGVWSLVSSKCPSPTVNSNPTAFPAWYHIWQGTGPLIWQ
jgi:hypothetical protein